MVLGQIKRTKKEEIKPRRCEVCGETFTPNKFASNQKYCSKICSQQFENKRKREKRRALGVTPRDKFKKQLPDEEKEQMRFERQLDKATGSSKTVLVSCHQCKKPFKFKAVDYNDCLIECAACHWLFCRDCIYNHGCVHYLPKVRHSNGLDVVLA
jgi:predicted nucleic acid-binding Zn ribbon protein